MNHAARRTVATTRRTLAAAAARPASPTSRPRRPALVEPVERRTLFSGAAPTAVDQSYNVSEDDFLVVNAANGALNGATDPESDPLTAAVISSPANGQLNFNPDGSFDYTPDLDFFGTDTFTFVADDGTGMSNVATVTLVVDPVNDFPEVTIGPDITINEDAGPVSMPGYAVSTPGPANESAAGDTVTDVFVDVDDPDLFLVQPSVDLATGTLTFTPAPNASGFTDFRVFAVDNAGDTGFSTDGRITITAVNDAPVAVNDSYSTPEGAALSILGGPGTTRLVASGDTTVIPIPLNITDATALFDASGTELDGSLVDVLVFANFEVYRASFAAPTGQRLTAGTTYTSGATGPSPTEGFLYIQSLTSGTQPSSIVGTFTVRQAFFDGSVFRFAADFTQFADGRTTPLTGTLEFDFTTTPAVTENDSEPDGDTLTAALVAGPSNGQLTFNPDGTFTYTPDPGFTGADTFTYLVNDGTVDSNVATVTINVLAALAPDAGGPYTVAEGATVGLSAANSTGLNPIVSYEWDTNYDGSTFVSRATGVGVTFDAAGLDGPSSRTVAVRVTDSLGNTAIDTAVVTVTNAAPTGTLTLSHPAVDEGTGDGVVTVSFANPADPSPADLAAGLLYSFDFDGDNVFDVVNSASPSAFIPGSIFADAAGSSVARTIRGRITDAQGASNTFSVNVTINNVAPTVTATPLIPDFPGFARLGQPLTFSASATDPSAADQAAGFTFAWVVRNGDTVLATGTGPTISLTPLRGGPITATVVALDKDGSTASATTQTIAGIPGGPRVTITAGSALEGAGSLPLTLTLSEPYAFPVTVRYAARDGSALNGTDFTSGTAAVTFAPGETSRTVNLPLVADSIFEPTETFTVDATVTDAPGQTPTAPTASAAASIGDDDPDARLVPDPLNRRRRVLLVSAGDANDVIQFGQNNRGVSVRVGNRAFGPFANVGRIAVFAGGGNDTVLFAQSVRPFAEVHGQAGNDTLGGGRGADILVGGDGADQLQAGRNDLAVAGRPDSDDTLLGFSPAVRIWSSSGRAPARLDRLTAPGAPFSSTRLPDDTTPDRLVALDRSASAIFAPTDTLTSLFPPANRRQL